ncbi:pectin lyase fold/virulence factor [Phellopilus nigrolimitatus]|nr:pectin lyase fold/virulence factor [Phellopilus nigrolimitatus]
MDCISEFLVAILLCCVSGIALAISPTFLDCQLQKSASASPSLHCPSGTIFVSPTDSRALFTSVQDAVLSLPEEGQAVILIGEGEYHETLNVTRSGPLTLLGQLNESALSPASNASSRNLVRIWNDAFVQTGMDDAQSAVLLPLFGNTDFKAYNIDFQNRAANFSISQALVTDISYANASFYGCTFASYQDTWYTGRNASTYVIDSIIFGQTDYLFGFGTAWFEDVTLANRACGGGIAAWKGTNLTEAPGNRYGAYISNSAIIRSPDANATLDITGDCFLGRPWNDLATTVYLRTFMDGTVRPAGWTPFDAARPTIMNTTFYAEYENFGPGANTSKRVSDHILTNAEAQDFTIEKVFLEKPQWIDFSYVH